MKTTEVIDAFADGVRVRFERIQHQLNPLPQDAKTFVAQLRKNKDGASIAYGRDCGEHSEQVFFDYAVVLDAAETISGIGSEKF